MTNQQIERYKAREEARANAAKEKLEESKQSETHRANREKEKLGKAKVVADTVKAVTGAGADFAKVVGAMNDPSWYNYDKQMVNDVANLSFGAPLGSRTLHDMCLTLSDKTDAQYTFDQALRAKVPGIMVLNFSPTAGNTGNKSSDSMAINIVAKNIYSYVRYANSGARNYESVDLMMYLLAMDSLISYRASLMRLYSLLLTAKAENWYYSKYIIKAMGFDYDNLIMKIPELRSYINVLGARICSFYVATDLPIYKRHAWLNLNIFKDHAVKRSQEYVFNQLTFWKWHSDPDVGTYLEAVPFNNGVDITFERIVPFGDDMINVLIGDEDVGIMSGDILKAYGDSAKLQFMSMPSDFHVESVFSEEVLSQITNATAIGPTTDTTTGQYYSNGVIQTTDGLIRMGYVQNKVAYPGITVVGSEYTVFAGGSVQTKHLINYQSKKIINMYKDSVTPDDVMVATRLVTGVAVDGKDYFGTGNSETALSCYGTEVLNNVSIVLIPEGAYDVIKVPGLQEYNFVQFQESGEIKPEGLIGYLSKFISSFDWAPHINISCGSYYDSKHYIVSLFDNRDLCNFAEVDLTNISSMHDVATLSEYRVPVTNAQKVRRY